MRIEAPILRKCDVLVIGGTLAGCRQVLSLREKRQCNILLAAQLNYLGEDVVGSGAQSVSDVRKWLGDETLTPAGIKAALEDKVLGCGADLIYEALPVKPALDVNHHIAGWLFLGRGGYFVIAAAVVIDATQDGFLSRQIAGNSRKLGGTCEHVLRLRQLGGCAVPADKEKDHARAGLEMIKVDDVTGVSATFPLCLYERKVACHLGDDAALAREIAKLRNDAWSTDTVAQAQLCEVVINGAPEAVVADGILRTTGDGADLSEKVVSRLNGAIRQLDPVAIPDRKSAHSDDCDVVWKNMARGERYRAYKRVSYELSSIPNGEEYDVIVVGGGTAGAPAAIAAARSGAKVLLIERLSELGGIMTAGRIGVYYHGNRCGFCTEMAHGMAKLGDAPEYDVNGSVSCREWKNHWLLKTALEAGVEVRFQYIFAGVAMTGRSVSGVAIASPHGNCTLCHARCVIDATGDAAVAAAAGALVSSILPDEPIVQGAGLNPLIPSNVCTNTDYQFICDSDCVDVTRAFVMAHDKFRKRFDVSYIPGTRERRRIVGEFYVQPQDIFMHRRYHDVIAVCYSCFDTHGAIIHPLLMMIPPGADHVDLRAQLPLRALIPQKLDGLLVVGLGLSAHRDAMPVLRMQPDAMNIGYSAGLAAALTVKRKCSVRALPLKELQEQILAEGILTPDEIPAADTADEVDAANPVSRLAAIFLRPDQERRRLQARFEQKPSLELATILAFLGDSSGRDFLQHAIAQAHWDTGWNYRGMGQFGMSVSPLDTLFFALRAIGGSPLAAFTKLKELEPDMELSHFRAIAMYFIRWPSSTAAIEWQRLLNAPGMSGHALPSLKETPHHNSTDVCDNSVRNHQLKELYIAAALFCCQPLSRDARVILEAYRDSPQAIYAEFASQILNRRRG